MSKELQKIILEFLIYTVKIVLLLSIILLLIISQYFYPIGSKMTKGITQKNISLLKANMHEDKIIDILGEPLYRKYLNYNDNADYSLIYARKGFFGIGGLSVYIVIDNHKLTYFEMKDAYYDGFYMCNEKKCPVFVEKEVYDMFIPKN